MSRKNRKAFKEEIKANAYYKPEDGFKVYAMVYGSEFLYTLEIENWDTMTKAKALHSINEHFFEEGEPQVNDVNRVHYFRIA